MYKPPQNCNRVKSIKSKFESIGNEKTQQSSAKSALKISPLQSTTEPSTENFRNSELVTHNGHQMLSRQLSDPLKRNIKRTPAFRLDKPVEASEPAQQTLFESKVKQFNSVKGCEQKRPDEPAMVSVPVCLELKPPRPNCDVSDNSIKQNSSFLHSHNCKNGAVSKINPHKTDVQDLKSSRPPLIKSKSSHDFQYIRNKFNGDSPEKPVETVNRRVNNLTKSKDDAESLLLKNIDLSLLYTEPIPKSLRNKNSSESSSGNIESPLFKPKIDNIYTKSTLLLTDSGKKEFLESLRRVISHDLPSGLTDSLRVALKKPLPPGPAPKKPPRTFQHNTESPDPVKNWKKPGKHADPKYMLNKLEMALKNNKLKVRKKQQVEVSTTSGEDSDDSLLFRSKSRLKPPVLYQDAEPQVNGSVHVNGSTDFRLGDFNCFNGFGCTNPAYERIKEPSSSFFLGKTVDPIYAEPIPKDQCGELNLLKNNRNSLYYMSTSLIPEDTGQSGSGTIHVQDQSNRMDPLKADPDSTFLNRQLSAENSSLSSFTSDLDSNPSPVTEDPHTKIRYLIENFESGRRKTLPKINSSHTNDTERRCTTPPDSSSRVELLRNSLRKTLDKSFNGGTSRDSDPEQNEEGKVARMVARFHTFQKSAPKYQQPKINTDTLFYCCLVIEKVQDCAQIKFKFPPNVDIPRDIEHLCFPESPASPPIEGSSAAQTYSLLVTSETGDRTYGYCRRVLPEGSTHCLPLAYCILSKYRAPRFYKKILLELESRHGMQNRYRDELISQFYHKKFPKPGQSITINLSRIEERKPRDSIQSCSNGLEDSLDLTSYIQVKKTGEYGSLTNSRKTAIFVSENDIIENCIAPSYVTYEGNKTELVLTLHPDTRYEDADLKKLHKLPADILLKIFSSLLLERKVIFISSVISELSSCVDSLQSILYPFTWYHTFIPILPESLWDIVESPTPVVCGVLSQEAVEDRHIENGIVVNLDTQSVLVEEGDEMKILSGSMHKVWRQFITLANNTKSMEYVYSVYLADAYLYVFIQCFKNYKQYVVGGQFMKDELVKNVQTKGIRRFLKMFTETCMFHAFMDAALNNPESLAAFDKKIEMYGSDESRIILDKLIDWHRKP